jgi:hypothetical protein
MMRETKAFGFMGRRSFLNLIKTKRAQAEKAINKIANR